MTSVNTTIEAMTRRGTLAAIFGAYSYAALLVAGPWIFTVVGLFSLSAATCEGTCIDLTIFRSILIYNSMYALIATSPLVFVGGRYASEQLHQGRQDKIYFGLVTSVAIFSTVSIGLVGAFYAYATTLSSLEKVMSVQNALLIGCSWLLIPFLGALRAYNSVLVAFAAGALSLFVFGNSLRDPQVGSLLFAFNASCAITDSILLAALVHRIGAKVIPDAALLDIVGKKWDLALAGGAYALGLWIDKIIMWRSSRPNGLAVAGALQTMPSYDTAMFWAQLSSIPIIAVFFVHAEGRFSSLLHAYHTRIQQQASLRELNGLVAAIRSHVLQSVFGFFVVLAVVAGLMILCTFAFMTQFGLRPAYMSVLRVSLCAMAFYTSAMFCFTFLLHLDLRRPALQVVLTFLVLNATLTMALLPYGADFYGYGNMIAAAASFLTGVLLVSRELSWLHYHAFITNNSGL
jgi:polysaccharide biosynthesis protein PelG